MQNSDNIEEVTHPLAGALKQLCFGGHGNNGGWGGKGFVLQCGPD